MSQKDLIPLSQRTKEEQKVIATKGGKRSGEVRRRKRDMKQKMQMLLDLPACVDDYNDAALMGVIGDIDNETIMLIALFREARAGNVQAVKEIRNILGKDIPSADHALKKKELKLKEQAAETNRPIAENEMPKLYAALENDDDV